MQQYIFKHGKDSPQDFEWVLPGQKLITAIEQVVIIADIELASRPYERVTTISHDFSIFDEMATVNDHFGTRDPDQFLQRINYNLTTEKVFKTKAAPEDSSLKSKIIKQLVEVDAEKPKTEMKLT